MSKRIRLLVISLTLAVIMIATVAGGTLAAGVGDQVRDCTDECVPDGDGPHWDRD